MCSTGNTPAHATANSVIDSAHRLIDVRHRWCRSSRIAEMSVPAWPMPIHHTKFTIAKPHATGTLMPQMPTPLIRSQVTAIRNSIMNANAIPKPTNQPSGVPLVRTIALILSLIVANVWPGAITAGSASAADGGRPVGLSGDAGDMGRYLSASVSYTHL